MDGEAIREIRDLARNLTFQFGEKRLSVEELHQIDLDPPPETLTVSTLTAIRDYLASQVDELVVPKIIVHVEGPCDVSVVGPVYGDWNKRTTWLAAKREDACAFKFGAYQDHETFMVGLLTQFETTPDLELTISCISEVKAEMANSIRDNGNVQTITTSKGVALAEQIKLSRLVKLRPYRTFREFQQPESPFVFRVRNNQGTPEFALHDASGAEWKTTAVECIRTWLTDNIPFARVIA